MPRTDPHHPHPDHHSHLGHSKQAEDDMPVWKLPELEGVDELSARAFRAFITTARLHFRHVMGAMSEGRAHHGQAMCLRLLSVNDGATQRDLARMMHVSPPTVSKMLSAMEKTGLVERRPDEADQRLTRVYVTQEGREYDSEIAVAVGDYVSATFGALPEHDRRDLLRLLEKLAASIALTGAPAAGASAARQKGADR
jgi:DNA-binding MarR family transcriptional regulator